MNLTHVISKLRTIDVFLIAVLQNKIV